MSCSFLRLPLDPRCQYLVILNVLPIRLSTYLRLSWHMYSVYCYLLLRCSATPLVDYLVPQFKYRLESTLVLSFLSSLALLKCSLLHPSALDRSSLSTPFSALWNKGAFRIRGTAHKLKPSPICPPSTASVFPFRSVALEFRLSGPYWKSVF